jgi:Rrf2 family transcriptional regulator, cysteine metabolism repressor
MKLSRRGLYALKALLVLAEQAGNDVVKIQSISEKEKIPQKFLESILVTLKNARIVESARGAMGGYRLKRSPDDIYLGEVVRLMDGPLAPFADAAELQRLSTQEDSAHQGLFSILLDVRNAAATILDTTSLNDVLKRTQTMVKTRPDGSTDGDEG